jgi:hypothetical protein
LDTWLMWSVPPVWVPSWAARAAWLGGLLVRADMATLVAAGPHQ